MTNFDSKSFEQLMGEAVRLHSEGHYDHALARSLDAYNIAPADSFEKGRAARDNSARYDRLGLAKEAQGWAETAYKIHDDLLNGMPQPTREALRERAASSMYVGVAGLRKVLLSEDGDAQGEEEWALSAMRQTWSDLAAAKSLAEGINRRVDQYEINAARRVSIAESFLGNKKAGLAIGSRAVLLAFWSESPRLDTASVELTTKQRWQAKTKAVLGGVAAIGAGVLNMPRAGKLRQFASRLAEKTL